METTLYEPKPASIQLPYAFVMRRLQSLSGFFLVLFLIEHLLTNSQAALFFGDDGRGFIDAVNFIYSLPYLPVIECALLGLPIAVHGIWGIHYLMSAKFNSGSTDGSTPSLKLPRNRAYTWQRITSVVLVIGILLHVGFMRFINHPKTIALGEMEHFIIPVTMDPGLYTLGPRLGLQLFDQAAIKNFDVKTEKELHKYAHLDSHKAPFVFDEQQVKQEAALEALQFQHMLAQALSQETLKNNQVAAVSKSFGTAVLLVVRDTFKSVWVCVLYSLFVVAACFHACNGLWTWAISWGITLTEKSRRLMKYCSHFILFTLLFLGLASIWGSYWINLRE